jgi:hypothetical protein
MDLGAGLRLGQDRVSPAILSDALAVAPPCQKRCRNYKRRVRPENGVNWLRAGEHPESVALRIKELLDRISVQELDHLLEEQDVQPSLPGRIESIELARHRRLRRVKPKAQLAPVVDQLEDLFVNGFQRGSATVFRCSRPLVRCQRVFVIAALRSDFTCIPPIS